MQTEKQVLTANATTSIVVGNAKLDDSIIVRYSCRRNALSQAGKIILMNKMSLVETNTQYSGDDMGLTFSGSFSGDNIQLDIALDNSDINVNLNYTIEKIQL